LDGGVLQSFGGGVVGTEIGIKVTEDSDAYAIAHALIVLEHSPPIPACRLGGWCGELAYATYRPTYSPL
jgi:hypothetical protein